MSIQVHTHTVVLRNKTFINGEEFQIFLETNQIVHYATLNSTMSIRKNKTWNIFHDISTNGVTGRIGSFDENIRSQ